MTVVNQKRNMNNRDNSKQEADHHAKMLPSTAWLMTIFQSKNTTVGIVATCSHRVPDLEPSIRAEIAYYTHGSLITQNCQWKYLLRPTTSKIAITHHHHLLLQETISPEMGTDSVARQMHQKTVQHYWVNIVKQQVTGGGCPTLRDTLICI